MKNSSNSLNSLLPEPKDHDAVDKLRKSCIYMACTSRTTRFDKLFVQYALKNYQWYFYFIFINIVFHYFACIVFIICLYFNAADSALKYIKRMYENENKCLIFTTFFYLFVVKSCSCRCREIQRYLVQLITLFTATFCGLIDSRRFLVTFIV
jgi:hypothetical protein